MKAPQLFLLSLLPASGLIFSDGADPPANVETAPTGAYAGSGWQYQLQFFLFHGTMISPKHFVTAAHGGNSATEVVHHAFFNETGEVVYHIKPGTRQIIGETDLAVFEIWESFPHYAPLYTKADEERKEVVICGRGVGRGEEIPGRGWKWSDDDSTRKSRWGRNLIDGSLISGEKDLLFFDFDNQLGQDEVGATGGDSGGGWFISDNGVWKLAAVSFSVDASYRFDPNDSQELPFRGVLYEVGGIYLGSDANGWNLIPRFGSSSDPARGSFYRKSHTYGSRISSSQVELEAIISPAIQAAELSPTERLESWLAQAGQSLETAYHQDPDRDGLTNLEEYLVDTDPTTSESKIHPFDVEFLPGEIHRFKLVETLDLEGRSLETEVQSSRDLVTWTPQSGMVEVSSVGNAVTGRRTRILEVVHDDTETQYYRLKISL